MQQPIANALTGLALLLSCTGVWAGNQSVVSIPVETTVATQISVSAVSGALTDPLTLQYNLVNDSFHGSSMPLRFNTTNAAYGLQATLLAPAELVGDVTHQHLPVDVTLKSPGGAVQVLQAGIPLNFTAAATRWNATSGVADSDVFTLSIGAASGLPVSTDHYTGQFTVAFEKGL